MSIEPSSKGVQIENKFLDFVWSNNFLNCSLLSFVDKNLFICVGSSAFI